MKKEIQKILKKYEIKFNKSDSIENLIQILKNSNKVSWNLISKYQKLSEDFIREFSDKVDWDYISQYQKLSEKFMKEFSEKVNWDYISIFQKLSKKMIKEFSEKVNWYYISKYQKLSEKFMKEFSEKVNWDYISIFQKLSKKMIKEFSEKVNWYYISKYQKLSEDFIKEFSDKVDWYYISIFQKLSEKFMKEFSEKVNWYLISKYQKLSKKMIKEYDLKIPDDNWIYKSDEFKLNYLKNNTNYEILNDEFVIAFKSVRSDNYSAFNFQYKYEIGKEYTSHCDCNQKNENSFGLSSWTKENALNYYKKGKLLKVKIPIKNIGAIVHDSNKIRSSKIIILEEIDF